MCVLYSQVLSELGGAAVGGMHETQNDGDDHREDDADEF
jgi:hypothetical protein